MFDALTDDDLITIGQACSDAILLTGGSGIALGLPANFLREGLTSGGVSDFAGIDGPEAVLAGSCSGATRQQIEVHAASHRSLNVRVDEVLAGRISDAQVVNFIHSHRGQAPLVYSAGAPEDVAATQQRYGRERVAQALERLFAASARRLVESGIRRLVVNKRPKLTPPSFGISMAWLADRRRDPTPINRRLRVAPSQELWQSMCSVGTRAMVLAGHLLNSPVRNSEIRRER